MSSVTGIQPSENSTPATGDTVIVKLREKYGASAKEISSLDKLGLIRTFATLEFLSNNLPASSRPAWLSRTLRSCVSDDSVA